MKVFEPWVEEGYEWALPANEDEYEAFAAFYCRPQAASWSPIHMQFLREDRRGRPRVRADFPWAGVSSRIILRPNAFRLLEPHLAEYGEFLPLTSPEGELWVFNVLRVVDSLDIDKSSIEYVPDVGGISHIKSYVFRESDVDNNVVFKIPQELRGPMYCTESLVNLVESSGFTGLGFRLLWDSDLPPFRIPLF